MKTLVIFIFLIIFSSGAIFRRLQTLTQPRFRSNDIIISTLGYFKMILLKDNCILRIQMFDPNNNTYFLKGNYQSPNVTNSCDYLELTNSSIITNSSQIFLGLPVNTGTASFTIDDNGVIQLIGFQTPTTDGSIPENVQANIRNFQTQQQYIQAYSNQTLDQQINGTLINKNNWVFSVLNTQFAIYKRNNTQLNVIYPFSKVTIRASGLYDFNGFQMPAAIFRNISFHPYCSEPGDYLDFKAPFTLQADQYWPILRFYEQGGYIVKEIAIGDYPSFYFPNEQKQISYYKRYSPCPDYTFLYRNQCLAECPEPYFHQMYGSTGKCVLVCEKSSPIDYNKRICSCNLQYENGKFNSKLITICPSGSKQTPYGCSCLSTNTYFDSKARFQCVSECPPSTFGRNGVCMQCSDKCTKCQLDIIKRYYLSCQQCAQGYKLQNGKCILQCNRYLGLQFIGGICQTCFDPNCVDCHISINQCIACQVLYALQENICVRNCSANYQIVHKSKGQAVCLAKNSICNSIISSSYKSQAFLVCISCPIGYLKYGDLCVLNCPAGFKSFQNQSCICLQKGQVLIGKNCYSLPACPIKTSYNLKTASCVSCPSGCLSCFENQCTSCSPGYLLFITPLYVACFRLNPLTTCQKQNSIQQGVCLVNNFADLSMNLCINRISNCRVCKYESNDICVLCKEGYLLYNNTCINTCFNGMIEYQNTCIHPEISQCQIPHLMTLRIPFIINLDLLLNAPFAYYSYGGFVPFNTPIAYIIIQQNSTYQYDSLTRDSFVTQVQWACLKCQKGYGLTFQGTCIACPSICNQCYLAREDSCIDKPNQTQLCPFKQKQNGNCLQSCSRQDQVPVLQNGTLFCIPLSQSNIKNVVEIDGAVYNFANQQKIVYFVLSNEIMGDVEVQVVQKTGLTSLEEQQLIQNSRLLQQIGSTTVQNKSIQDGTYVLIDSTFKEAFILNLTNSVSKIRTSDGQFLANSVYGVTDIQSHPQFMKLWLAYIGYVVSIVVIVLHALFIGNDLIYKVDNLLIFIQSLYYFSFVKLLVGKLLAQYYYGWIYAHGGFFPNYFQSLPPNGYFQQSAPDSYKIATLDANFYRNGGSSLSFFITFVIAFIIITLFVYIIAHVLKKFEIWYPELAKNSAFAGIQFFSMNIFYWAVANLMYRGGGYQLNKGYYQASIVISAFMITLFSIIAFVRLYFHFLGGIYMLKRLLIAVILAAAAVNKNIFIIPLIALQILFFLVRWYKQQPESLWQRIFIIGQLVCFIGLYFMLFFSINAGVNTIILSIFIFIFVVLLFMSLSDIYLESQQQYFLEQNDPDQISPRAKQSKAI